jgi:cyclopropane fatty-acyl-phospholipid synthase-like methyltransferase
MLRSNLANWKEMQENNYFENHPGYQGLVDTGDFECRVIDWFLPLSPQMKVVVIGCGYGRESLHIARRVGHVFGIDVSERILEKARRYLHEKGVSNFTPVLADNYKQVIPTDIDLVFSFVVMQHLTRDLVKDYLANLGRKLSPAGKMVIQFLEHVTYAHVAPADAELKTYEPSVSWSLAEIVKAAQAEGLTLEQARSHMGTPHDLWHWVFIGRDSAKDEGS